MELKTVFRAFNSAEAQLVRSQLEAAGFTVFVADETSALSMDCLLYTSPSPRDQRGSRMPSSA